MRQLLTARWLLGHFVVLVVCVGCLVAGFWQLDRLEQRRTNNAVQQARYRQEPLPIGDLVDLSGGDLASLEFRRATATGRFLPGEEVLVRSQVFAGRAGFDVVTPLVLEDGRAVAVNRGWVPLEFDTTPVEAAPPPEGEVTVEAVVRLSQEPGAFSPAETPSQGVDTVSRVDVGFLDRITSVELLPVYIEEVGGQDPTALPVPAAAPDFSDEGPHLSYAIQWFSFAAVGAIGYGFLIRRALNRPSGGREGEVGDDVDAGQTGQIPSRQTDLGPAGPRPDHD